MKSIKFLVLIWCMIFFTFVPAQSKNLKGKVQGFVYSDTVFKNPYIDVDKMLKQPIECRYIHGGFEDGTKFSFYFPKKESYKDRFFQYITPFPDSEIASQNYPYEISPIVMSIKHGAYFVETNEGGRVDFTDMSKQRDPSIGAYRANAACAELSRWLAKQLYQCQRPYGYCYGGSGGAYRTTGGMENLQNVWDGSVPFVLGSPSAIPNVFAVRMRALRLLKDKMDDIVDALEPGGSGDPYATLSMEQRQVLQEATRMGFPIKSWYGWKQMDAHGFLVLYKSVVRFDPTYFNHDFWQVPGYEGFDNPHSLQKDRVRTKTVVKRVIGQQEAERLKLVSPLSESERGTADRSWAAIGSDLKDKPVAYELNLPSNDIGMGGDLIILGGTGKGIELQITKTQGHYVALAPTNAMTDLAKLRVGDSVQVDNSNFLAVQTYYRHQIPSKDYYVWNQFRGYNDRPIYPQRPVLLGPLFTQSAAGCLPEGKINGKMILLCSVWDREAFAWQGDWYRKKVEAHLGLASDNNFRLWYTDRALHADAAEDNPIETVSYMSTLAQALLDLSDWVERGISPSKTTDYQIVDGQVILSDNGADRGGLQPTVKALINGKERADVAIGEKVIIQVTVDVPKGTGSIVKADWCLDGKKYSLPVDLSQATMSDTGEHAEFETTFSFDKPGIYFPTVKVYSQRNGNPEALDTAISNLGKVRVVVR